jgi:twitching motility protein PilU
LFELYETGQISYEEGLRNADSKNEIRLRIKLESKREDHLQAEASSTLRIVDESNEGKLY